LMVIFSESTGLGLMGIAAFFCFILPSYHHPGGW
jgi:hypothetical protein